MHIQSTVPNWTQAIPHLPAGGGVRALGSPSWLVQVKQIRPDLYTSYRFFIGDGQTAEGTWEECKEHWRRIYRRWVDKTYLEQYAPHIDMVSEANEYAATTTWQSTRDTNRVMQSLGAAVAVWENEYRGRWVSSADGGRGFIPAKTRLSLLAQPVSNNVPRAVMRLALDTDNVIDYRAYCKCVGGVRVPECWEEHSGRWHFMEEEAGLKPLWMFGESGPYLDTFGGWRTAGCLGHDETKLYGVMRAWFRDVASTAAFREGRILGSHGFWYNTGDPNGIWKDYELDTGHLVRLAQIAREELTPQEVPVNDTEKAAVAVHAVEILKIVKPEALQWWARLTPPYKLAATGRVVLFYNADGSPRTVAPTSRAVGAWDVFAVSGDLLRVTNFNDPAKPDWWVKAQEVQPA